MIATVSNSFINSSVEVTASKSISQRALILSLLNSGVTNLYKVGDSNDELAVLQSIQDCGAILKKNGDHFLIKGIEKLEIHHVYCGESALAFRLFTPLAALGITSSTISAGGSLLKREMPFFEKEIKKLVVSLSSKNGKAPISVQGPLAIKDVTVDASDSSQYISGLLMAFAKGAVEPVSITVNNLVSDSYLHLTCAMLNHFGYSVSQIRNKFFIQPSIPHKDVSFTIEGDWSNAAYWLVAGAISESIQVSNLNAKSLQGDRAIIDVLQQCGVKARWYGDVVEIKKSSPLKPFIYNATHTPDLFPPLVVLAFNCTGLSRIKGIHRLINKESNRVSALIDVFGKLGGNIRLEQDEMVIQGIELQGGSVSSHDDHRIVMAAAIAGLSSKESVTITNASCTAKSYPSFFDELKKAGASVTLQHE